MNTKPTITFDEFARDGNIFSIAAAVRRAYQREGRISEWFVVKPYMAQHSYEQLIGLYAVMVTFADDDSGDDEFDIWGDA